MRIAIMMTAALLLAGCDVHKPDWESVLSNKTPSAREANLITLAGSTAAAGDAKAAEDTYRQAIKISRGSVDAHLGLADLYRRTDNNEAAVGILKDALELQAEDRRVLIALGHALIAQNQHASAVEYFDRALKSAPGDVRALNGKAVCLDAAEKYAEAQALYKKALAQKTRDNDYIRNNLALSYILAENFDEAILTLKPLAEGEESKPTYRQNLAMAYGLKGQGDLSLLWGMKDLSEDQARENVEFYQYIAAAKPKTRKAAIAQKVETAVTPVEAKELEIPEKLPEPKKEKPVKKAEKPKSAKAKEPVKPAKAKPEEKAKPDEKKEVKAAPKESPDQSVPAVNKDEPQGTVLPTQLEAESFVSSKRRR